MTAPAQYEPLFQLVERQTPAGVLTFVALHYNRRAYVFSYCYERKEDAEFAMGNLKNNFGKPSGVDADLENNYIHYRDKYKLEGRARTRNSSKPEVGKIYHTAVITGNKNESTGRHVAILDKLER